jgi:hypothetical protein
VNLQIRSGKQNTGAELLGIEEGKTTAEKIAPHRRRRPPSAGWRGAAVRWFLREAAGGLQSIAGHGKPGPTGLA